MTVYNKWKIFCNTESSFKEVILDSTQAGPDHCPVDGGHEVNLESVHIGEVIDTNIITIDEGQRGTQGYFRSSGLNYYVDAMTTGTFEFALPYNATVLSIECKTNNEYFGDILNLYIAPDTIIGTLNNNASIGDNSIDVGAYIDNCKIGFLMSITDGVNVNQLGEITSINTNTNQITFENALTNNFLTSSPTYLRITANPIKNYIVGHGMRHLVGESKLGGSLVPAGKIRRVKIQNNTPKKIMGHLTSTLSIGENIIYVTESTCDKLRFGDKIEVFLNSDVSPVYTITELGSDYIKIDANATQEFVYTENVSVPRIRRTGKQYIFNMEYLL